MSNLKMACKGSCYRLRLIENVLHMNLSEIVQKCRQDTAQIETCS